MSIGRIPPRLTPPIEPGKQAEAPATALPQRAGDQVGPASPLRPPRPPVPTAELIKRLAGESADLKPEQATSKAGPDMNAFQGWAGAVVIRGLVADPAASMRFMRQTRRQPVSRAPQISVNRQVALRLISPLNNGELDLSHADEVLEALKDDPEAQRVIEHLIKDRTLRRIVNSVFEDAK